MAAACGAGSPWTCAAEETLSAPGSAVGEVIQPAGLAVVEHDLPTRGLLARVFALSKEFRCSGFFRTAAEALARLVGVGASLILVDLQLPDPGGIECARELVVRQPGLGVVIIGRPSDPALIGQAVAAGAADRLVKPFSIEQCLTTLHSVRYRSLFRTPQAPVGAVFSEILSAIEAIRGLDPLEQDVLRCLANGMAYKHVEDALHLTRAAVINRVRHIHARLHVHNTPEAVRLWAACMNAAGNRVLSP